MFLFSCQVEIFADVLNGHLSILASGGYGNKGQNGKHGRPGIDNLAHVR